MIIHVSAVTVVGPHSLELAFDNGVRKPDFLYQLEPEGEAEITPMTK